MSPQDNYVIGIDGGTGSIRAVLFTVDGVEKFSVSRDWEHRPEPGVLGSMGFDTISNRDLVLDLLREIVETAGVAADQIVAISSTAMREAFVLLDKDGEAIWACANVDARAIEEVKELGQDTSLQQRLYERSGQTFALSAQPRLTWIKKNRPEIYDQVDTLIMVSDWILFALGGKPVMEPSNGSTSGLLDLATRQCDPELLTMCSLRGDILPETVEPGTVIGRISHRVAEVTGLHVDTKLVVGGGDT